MPSGPKNTKFTNRHAVEAMEREESKKAAQRATAAKAQEDAMWEDNDPKASKKLEKEREAQEKAREAERRRAESQAQLEAEERDIGKQPTKVSKKAMQRDVAKLVANYDKEYSKIRSAEGPSDAQPLPKENANRSVPHQASVTEVKASGISSAVTALEATSLPDDRHIGKRAKVLYRLFCDENTGSVKEKHPGLRRTQYNDILWEMWQKSPQNPFVVRSEQRSSDRLEAERRWMEGGDDEEEPADL